MVVAPSRGRCSVSLCNFLSDYLFYVYAPKYVTIYNRRLGVLFRLMQAAAIAWVGVTLSWERPWFDSYPVAAYGHNVWVEDGDPAVIANKDVDHCRNLELYKFGGNGSRRPRRCSRPHRGERMQVTSTDVFLYTMVLDTFNWDSSGQGCNSSSCTAAGKGFNASCRCKLDDAFFITNVDEDKVFFHHGYSVTFEDVHGRASTPSRRVQVNSSDPRIRTRIVKPDGSDCVIGKKTMWSHRDAHNGIGGSVREWLECGGYRLDKTLHDMGSDVIHQDKDGKYDVRLRTAGADVNLHFYYEGELGKFQVLWESYKNYDMQTDIECIVKVEVVPKWKSWELFSFLYPPTAGLDAAANRFRHSYGLSFQTKTHGSIRKLSSSKILTIIVNSIVMIMFPAQVVYWIILYGVGLLSEIYYKAANEDLDVHDSVSGVGVRMLNAMCAFKSLKNKGHQWSGKTLPLPIADVFEGMCVVLDKHMADGVLDDAEVAQLVACMMDSLDVHDEAVSMGEFVKVSTSNEIMDLSLVAQLFDVQRKPGLMERIFDDTPKEIHAHRKASKQNTAPKVTSILRRSALVMEETQTPECSQIEMQELFGQPSALTQTITTAVAQALGDLPARLEQLEMEANVLRNLIQKPEAVKEDVPFKKQTPTDGFEHFKELDKRVARLEANRLEEGWRPNVEALEARISCLEIARSEEAWSQVTQDLAGRVACLEESLDQQARSSSSSYDFTHPEGQLSKWSDAAHEEAQLRTVSRSVIIETITPRHDPLARPKGSSIPAPAFISGTDLDPTTAMTQSHSTRWLRRAVIPRNSNSMNDNLLQHRRPSRDTTLGNQFPVISSNMGLNRVLLPAQSSISGHQRVLCHV
mmetsp:Transcript_59988/g.119024  ORF Transcript_59988/g.119024 Transcript_59988/m.119024 type:complete len:860 (+) Transcript_59988:81-2660(+)|eukprot:CAMPEP_0172798240 /NCGR_PEP_ID=MMETSP1075-20121228/1001_1 /TAXON_ID=2916 /ORGANISM="Ceratium fusus, Strain PA161109" /LENGTH=859 /DNA_ID=CAMNT_0013635655 /DNA_START=79 /DNA_END=2658 /DNA_ORIENTATION=+